MAPIITAILPTVMDIIGRVLPDPKAAADAKLKALELAQAGELAQLDADVKLAVAQLEVNKADASAAIGAFRAGWRPSIGYILAAALAFKYVLNPALIWANAMFGLGITPPDIGLDADMWQLMFGMLGMAGWRSLDKRSGKDK